MGGICWSKNAKGSRIFKMQTLRSKIHPPIKVATVWMMAHMRSHMALILSKKKSPIWIHQVSTMLARTTCPLTSYPRILTSNKSSPMITTTTTSMIIPHLRTSLPNSKMTNMNKRSRDQHQNPSHSWNLQLCPHKCNRVAVKTNSAAITTMLRWQKWTSSKLISSNCHWFLKKRTETMSWEMITSHPMTMNTRIRHNKKRVTLIKSSKMLRMPNKRNTTPSEVIKCKIHQDNSHIRMSDRWLQQNI